MSGLAGAVPRFPKALLERFSLGAEWNTIAGRDTIVIGAFWQVIDPRVAVPPNLRGDRASRDIWPGLRRAKRRCPFAFAGPIVPRGNGRGVLPEASARRTGLLFHTVEAATLRSRKLLLIGTVEPGHPGFDLREVKVEPIANDEGEEPVIPVRLFPGDSHRLFTDQLREVAAGDLTERLSQFRGVDAGQSNPVFATSLVDDRQGVPVAYPGHPGHHRPRLAIFSSRGKARCQGNQEREGRPPRQDWTEVCESERGQGWQGWQGWQHDDPFSKVVR